MPGSRIGAPSTCTLFGPPDRMIADGRAILHLGGGDPMRHDLGVHPQLANTPSDELGVLRPEVDDQHGVASLTRGWLVDAIDSRT